MCEVRHTSYRYYIIRALAAFEIVPAIVLVEVGVREGRLTRVRFLQQRVEAIAVHVLQPAEA